MRQVDSSREGDVISPFALVAAAVRRDSLRSSSGSLGSAAPTSVSENRQQPVNTGQDLVYATPGPLGGASSLSALSPFAQQAMMAPSSNASAQGITEAASGALSQDIHSSSERGTSLPSVSEEQGEQAAPALVVPLTISPGNAAGSMAATAFHQQLHPTNHLPPVLESATEGDKIPENASESHGFNEPLTPRARDFEGGPPLPPPTGTAATGGRISAGSTAVAQLLASLPQGSQLPPRSPYSPGYSTLGVGLPRHSSNNAPVSPMRRSGPSVSAPAPAVVPASLQAAPVTSVQLQMAALQALQNPAEQNTAAATAAQRLQMQQTEGGVQGIGLHNGSVDAIPPFFPAARYSLSLDSMRSSLSEDGANVASAIAAEIYRKQQSGRGGRHNDQAAALIHQVQQRVQQLPRVRALVSAGGHFKQAPPGTGGVPYIGGEVRLVNLPEGCSYLELVAVLAKTERTQHSGGGGGGGSSGSFTRSTTSAMNAVAALLSAHAEGIVDNIPRYCLVRYQLPSDQSVLVDLLDDEDVRLMFEEQAELRARQGITAPKLHLYVQWEAPRGSIFSGDSDDVLMNSAYSAFPPGGSSSSLDSEDLNSTYTYNNTSVDRSYGVREDSFDISRLGELGFDDTQGRQGFPSRRLSAHSARRDSSFAHAAHRSASDLRLAAVRTDQLEAISAKDVILTSMMGTGTVGDMYKGTWRSCDVAVKVLNPAAVGLKYTSRSAWLSFLADANSMGALRHPNLVEVYGIVLPGSMDMTRTPSIKQPSDYMAPYGEPPEPAAMGGRRMSWDFAAGSTPLRSSGSGATNLYTHGIQQLPGPVAAPPAIVMELVSGRSLHGAIERREDSVAGKLTRVVYALDVARGMAYLHSKGVTHFNLKSTNVLLGWRNRRPTAKVAAYMLSNRKTVLTSYTPGVTMSRGVLPWVAPEVLRCPTKVGQKSDVYAFGIILYELWSLRAPYNDQSYRRLVSALVNSDEIVRPIIPGEEGTPRAEEPAPGWKSLVERCWAEDPDARPVFSDIVDELREMAKVVKDAQRVPGSAAQVAGAMALAGKGNGKAVDDKGPKGG